MFWKQGQAWSWNGSDEETAQVSKLVGLGPQGRKKQYWKKGSRVELGRVDLKNKCIQ